MAKRGCDASNIAASEMNRDECEEQASWNKGGAEQNSKEEKDWADKGLPKVWHRESIIGIHLEYLRRKS